MKSSGQGVKHPNITSSSGILSKYLFTYSKQLTLLGRGLLVSSQLELEATAGKGDATTSPDERYSLSRRSSRRDGVYCPRCRSESVIRYGSYRVFQRYLCEDCDRTFNDQTGTIFEHSAVKLRKWFLAVYTYIRFNTDLRQLNVEIDVSYKTIYPRPALPASAGRVSDPSRGPRRDQHILREGGTKGSERDQSSRSRGLSTRGRGTFAENKLPVFVLVDRGSSERYVTPGKEALKTIFEIVL